MLWEKQELLAIFTYVILSSFGLPLLPPEIASILAKAAVASPSGAASTSEKFDRLMMHWVYFMITTELTISDRLGCNKRL